MKFVSNVLEIIDIIYYPSKLVGLAPYVKSKDENNVRIYVLPKSSSKYFCYTLIVCIFIIFYTVTQVLNVQSKGVTYLDVIRGCTFLASQISLVVILFEATVEKKFFIQCLELIQQSEATLLKLEKKILYKFLHVIIICILAFFFVHVFSTVVLFIEAIKTTGVFSKKTSKYFMRIINIYSIFYIRYISIYLYTTFIYIASQAMSEVNKYVTELNDQNDFVTVKKVIVSGLDMHHLVTELTQKISKTFGFTMHATVTTYVLDMVALITLRGALLKRNPWFLVINNITYTLCTIAAFLVSEKLNFEKCKIKVLIADLKLPYIDEELSDLRQTFYYRLFHEQDEVNAAGFYDLNVKTITTQVGFFLTMLTAFLNMRSILTDST